MNKLKKMVIKSIEDAKMDGIFKESVKEHLINNVDDYCDKIIELLLKNDNVDIKSYIGIDTSNNSEYRWKPVIYIDLINNPILQEENFNITFLIK